MMVLRLRGIVVGFVCVGALACSTAPPPRTSFARYPGAPAERDASQSDPRALAIADRVFAAAGGAHWDAARELRWTQTTVGERVQDVPRPRPGLQQHQLVIDSASATTQEHCWDRWNARYALHWRDGNHQDAFAFDVYDSHTLLTTRDDDPRRPVAAHVIAPMAIAAEGSGGVRASWHASTALAWLPFLLREPGAKLAYLEPVYDDDGEADRVRLTFPADPRRSAAALELTISKADVIKRVSIETAPDVGDSYELSDWITVAGLAVPTKRVDLSTGAVTSLTEIFVSPTVNNDDFVWPD